MTLVGGGMGSEDAVLRAQDAAATAALATSRRQADEELRALGFDDIDPDSRPRGFSDMARRWPFWTRIHEDSR